VEEGRKSLIIKKKEEKRLQALKATNTCVGMRM
jgi:hypothetical protein